MILSTNTKLTTFALVCLTISACSSGGGSTLPEIPLPDLSLPDVTHAKLPFVHRIDIQQGNVVTQEMIAQLRYGMDKKKVRYIMGTPIIQDTFHSKRWDYLYTEQEGGDPLERRRVTLFFENELLVGVDGDVKPAEGRLVVDLRQDTQVEVPGEFRKGFLARMKDSMPLIGDDDEESESKQEDDEETDPAVQADTALETVAKSDDSEDTESDDTGALDDSEPSKEELAAAEESAVVVPEDAPKKEKKRGFFKRIFDSIGLGAEEDEEDEIEYDTADPRYRRTLPQDDL